MSATIIDRRELARQTDDELLDTYYRDRDVAARNELVHRFMPFARKLAIRYVHSREPLDDLIQVACVGLLNAIDRFDPDQGRGFTTFAAPTILGELKRYFRDKGWAIHVPRNLKERALAVSRHAERLSVEFGRSPTVVQLAEALGCTIEQAVDAIQAGENYQLTSLDAPVAEDDQERCSLGDTLGAEDDGFDLAEDRQALATSWPELSSVERQVLGLRLVDGLTQREISRQVGCSQMQVSRLLRKSMVSLNADWVRTP